MLVSEKLHCIRYWSGSQVLQFCMPLCLLNISCIPNFADLDNSYHPTLHFHIFFKELIFCDGYGI